MLKSILDLSSQYHNLPLTDEEPRSNIDNYEEFKNAVNVGEPYNGVKVAKPIDDYIQVIANQQRREPFVVYPLRNEPRASNIAFEPSQEARSSRSRGDV